MAFRLYSLLSPPTRTRLFQHHIVCVWLGGFRLDGKSLYKNLDSETLQFKVVQWNDGFSESQFFV